MRISNLFNQKPIIPTNNTTPEPPKSDVQTYFEAGCNDCLSANGDPKVLNVCLDNNFQSFKKKCENDFEKQNNLKSPLLAKKTLYEGNIRGFEAIISNEQTDIEKNRSAIAVIRDLIIDMRKNPLEHGIKEKKSKSSFLIGLIILLPITLYLLVFYLSASFSAFFKEFGTNSNVIDSIFDANALTKAYEAGFMEAVFVITIPFAFLGLGYLIHMFQKEDTHGAIKAAKLAAIFIVTFIFDCILAYQIEDKIYSVNKTLESSDFNFAIAFQTPAFWGIIFAGFVVYIIWGFVFDFVMKEYDGMDKVSQKIAIEKRHISDIEKKIEKAEQKIKESEEQIKKLQTDINVINSKLNSVFFVPSEYALCHTEFLKGWITTIAKKLVLGHAENAKLISECTQLAETHLANVLSKNKSDLTNTTL